MAAPNPNFYEKKNWDNGLLGEFSVGAGKWFMASNWTLSINLLACYVQRDIIIAILRIIKFFGDKKDNPTISQLRFR